MAPAGRQRWDEPGSSCLCAGRKDHSLEPGSVWQAPLRTAAKHLQHRGYGYPITPLSASNILGVLPSSDSHTRCTRRRWSWARRSCGSAPGKGEMERRAEHRRWPRRGAHRAAPRWPPRVSAGHLVTPAEIIETPRPGRAQGASLRNGSGYCFTHEFPHAHTRSPTPRRIPNPAAKPSSPF